jgi:hypothetical protein
LGPFNEKSQEDDPMFRKLLMVGAVVTAVLVPIGIAAASTLDERPAAMDEPSELQVPDAVQQVNPDCDGTCDGAGFGAGPRDGTGPVHEGPNDGTGNRFGAANGGRGHGAAGERGIGAGPRDGSGPIHVGPADGTGNRFGVAAGVRNPDDGFECDGTRRHAPNTTETSG